MIRRVSSDNPAVRMPLGAAKLSDREIGLLRAVGVTRKQLTAILMGESALTALFGAFLGIVFGTGIAALTALSLGGAMFGMDNLNLQVAALKVVGMSLLDGIPMVLAAPLFSALITYPIARSALRGSAIEALQPERRG